MEAKMVRVCPKCLSTDVVRDLSLESYGKGTFFNQFKCNKCGFTGIVFPEVRQNELEDLKRKMKK
jgi:predicted RNA-binding Zn-ribbon protein involved in translation (DUF1610 family)